jgi:hypothetical protein
MRMRRRAAALIVSPRSVFALGGQPEYRPPDGLNSSLRQAPAAKIVAPIFARSKLPIRSRSREE